jgi:hypothetical protein
MDYRKYDKATEVTTSGTIRAIERQQDHGSVPGNVPHVADRAAHLSVHMGMWSAAKMPFHVGDQVQVTGSLITVSGGKQILLARTVTSASQTITVRTTGGQALRPSALASNHRRLAMKKSLFSSFIALAMLALLTGCGGGSGGGGGRRQAAALAPAPLRRLC